MQYNYIPPGYVPFSFDDLASIIAVTQSSKRLIRKEHTVLANFYKSNSELLYEHLEERLEVLEDKKDTADDLTEFEENELFHLYRLLDERRPAAELFEFQKDFFLDNYQKVWIQLGKKGVDFLKENTVVDIVYYAIEQKNMDACPVGKRFDDGSINTGSRLVIRVLRVNHKDAVTQYKMLCN